MLFCLLLALLSGLAPRGVEVVHDARQVAQLTPELEVDHAVIQQTPRHHSQFPDSPVEVEEEELREFKSSDVHDKVVVRACISFLAGFLPPTTCLASPPRVLRKSRVEPISAVSRTILHRVFLI